MLRRYQLSLFAIAAIGSVYVYACGGSSDSGPSGNTGGGGTGGGKADPVLPGAQPPAKPAGPAAAGTTPTVIAVNKLLLGDTDPATGQADASYWKKLGYNLDGIISTKNGTNHCKPQTGATPSTVKTDGDNGIDNSFGENLMPIIGSLASNPSQTISDSLMNGDFTIMLKLDKLEDPATKPDQTGISAGLYGGAKFASLVDCKTTPNDPNCSPPKFDGTDKWPIVPELLNNNNPDDPKVKFTDSYVAGGTWASGSFGTLNLTVSIQGFSLTLNIAHAVLTMKLTGVAGTAKATDGIIAGVIPTEQLITELKKVAGGFDSSLCEGATFESIAQEIRQASDIMQDGTNGDPTVTCDGISVGLGFEGAGVQLGGIAPAASAPTDPCSDAGATGGAGGTGGSGGTGGGTAGSSSGGTAGSTADGG